MCGLSSLVSGVSVMKDEDLNLEEMELYNTLDGSGRYYVTDIHT